jgi:hypothetical protein
MNQSHFPRSLIILLFILVSLSFIVGTLRAFTNVHAISTPMVTPAVTLGLNTPSTTPPESENETPVPSPTAIMSSQATSMSSSPSTPVPVQDYSTDMTGIISLGILMVVVVLVGVTWGGRDPRKKKDQGISP